jgi:hypothetical protein
MLFFYCFLLFFTCFHCFFLLSLAALGNIPVSKRHLLRGLYSGFAPAKDDISNNGSPLENRRICHIYKI